MRIEMVSLECVHVSVCTYVHYCPACLLIVGVDGNSAFSDAFCCDR